MVRAAAEHPPTKPEDTDHMRAEIESIVDETKQAITLLRRHL